MALMPSGHNEQTALPRDDAVEASLNFNQNHKLSYITQSYRFYIRSIALIAACYVLLPVGIVCALRLSSEILSPTWQLGLGTQSLETVVAYAMLIFCIGALGATVDMTVFLRNEHNALAQKGFPIGEASTPTRWDVFGYFFHICIGGLAALLLVLTITATKGWLIPAEKIIENNYTAWVVAFLAGLRGYKILKFLAGKLPIPNEENSKNGQQNNTVKPEESKSTANHPSSLSDQLVALSKQVIELEKINAEMNLLSNELKSKNKELNEEKKYLIDKYIRLHNRHYIYTFPFRAYQSTLNFILGKKHSLVYFFIINTILIILFIFSFIFLCFLGSQLFNFMEYFYEHYIQIHF